MTATITYTLSTAGQRVSILSGGNGHEVQTLSVPTDSPDYPRLVQRGKIDKDGNVSLIVGSYAVVFNRPKTSTEILDWLDQEDAKSAEKKRQQLAELTARAMDTIRERKTTTSTYEVRVDRTGKEGGDWFARADYPVLFQAWTYGDPDEVKTSPDAVQWQQELDQTNAAARAAALETARKLAQAKVAEETATAQRIEDLRTWAKANGSDLLRAREQDGYEWVALAEREYADLVLAVLSLEPAKTPRGYQEPDEVEDRTTPTLEEIECIRAVRTALEGKPATAELIWVSYDPDEPDPYDDEGAEPLRRAEVRVVVTTPTNRKVTRDYLPGQVPVPVPTSPAPMPF